MRRPPRALDLRSFPGVGPVAVATLVFLYAPILITTIYAFNGGQQALVWDGFSTRWFGYVLTNTAMVTTAITSLKLAAVATAASVVLALAFVLAADGLRRTGSGLANALLSAPLVIPEVVLAVATLGFIRMIGLQPGFTALVLAHTTFCIPFAMMPIRSRLQGLGQEVFEAGADLGARAPAMLRRITLPLLVPGIVSGALLAFVVSMDDFIISAFLSSAGSTTLPVYLFSLIRRGPSPAINVVAVLLLVLAVLITTVTYLAPGKKRSA
ncbi:ABC transporter permease [Cellulomonas citrea]|uniref:ABC transporter permease n=1 Tax=Cellulomonas citrea TaxID=1909423 RepID=UPI001F3DDE78|nr:ABC transporter permease [Cellulomonas citrea]